MSIGAVVRSIVSALLPCVRSRGLALLVACATPLAASAAPFPAQIDLADLDPANGGDGSIGVLLNGQTTGDTKGKTVAGADLTGDGLADVIVGSNGVTLHDEYAAYVMFGGRQLPASFDLLEEPVLSGGEDGFIFELPASPEDREMSAIGDLNADGFDDFVVTMPSLSQAVVVFGRGSGFPPVLDGATFLPNNGGDGSEGFELTSQTSDLTGESASGGCDFNADGIADLVLGGSQSGPAPGRTYVVFGRSSGFPPLFALRKLRPENGGDGSEGVVIEGVGEEASGSAVACLGDTNGDGIDDVLVGASAAGADVQPPGGVYLVFGHDAPFAPVIQLSALLPENGGDGSEGSVFYGPTDFDHLGFGRTPVSGGDVNGDGLDDLLLGSLTSEVDGSLTGSGRVFIVYGRAANDFSAVFDLSDLFVANGGDGSDGVVVKGGGLRDQAAYGAAAGDVNDDGVGDFLVGAVGALNTGAAYVVFGRLGGLPAEIDLASLQPENGGDGSQGVVLKGVEALDEAGFAVGGAGDVNGDGVDDVLVGAPKVEDDDGNLIGEAYLVYGRPAEDDDDGDGVPAQQDNCSAVANADQRDTDGDGFGNACDADLDGNCSINFSDLALFKARFFSADPDADFNGDGAVNFGDLSIMKAGFFLPPGPSGVPNACAQ